MPQKRKKRIDTRSSKTTRMFELFLRLHRSNSLIALSDLATEEWGCTKTISRTLNELNRIWVEHHSTPLFELVDADGQTARRGERFIRILDDSVRTMRSERLAVLPAVFAFLKVLDGTIIADELAPIFERLTSQNAGTRKTLATIKKFEKKFYLVGKGIKSYSSNREVLDAIYDALLKETKVRVTVRRGDEIQTHILCPLSLLFFNNGLYLISHFENQDPETQPYRWRIENFSTAEVLKGQRFAYPAAFDPKQMFDGEFGIYSANNITERQVVEIAFDNDPEVRSYVESRKFTGNETYRDSDDGRFIMRLEVSDLTEIRSWILSWGARAEVLRPRGLRQDIAKTVQRLASLYSA